MTTPDNSPGQEQATRLFLQYYNYVRAVAFEVAPSPYLQEDIAHDVFVEFVRNAEKWDYSRDVKPLLRKMTRNIALTHWRTYMKNLPETLQKLAAYLGRENGEDQVQPDVSPMDEQLLALDLCLAKLPRKSQLLVESHYFNREAYSEIARQTNRTADAVAMAMSRVRATLKQCIEKRLREV